MKKRSNYKKARKMADKDFNAILDSMNADLCEKVRSDIFKNEMTLRGAVTMLVALQIFECHAGSDSPLELNRVALTLLYQNRIRQLKEAA